MASDDKLLLTKKDLSELISAYTELRIEIKDFNIEEVKKGFNINSQVYKISNIQTDSPFASELTAFLKIYLTEYDKIKKEPKYSGGKIAFRSALLDEKSEKAFYSYANKNLKWRTELGEEKRVAPFSFDRALPYASFTRQKFDNKHMILLFGYKNGNIRDILKRLKEEKEDKELKWFDIKSWFFDPLALLWVKATAEIEEIEKHMPNPVEVGRVEHEHKIYAPSPETLTKRHVGYYALIFSEELPRVEKEKLEEILKDIKNYFSYFAPYVAAKEIKEEKVLRSVVHGDCFWRNYIGDYRGSVLIDFTNFRISSWLTDVASLIGNPYITEDLGLKFDPEEVIESAVEKIISIQKELRTEERIQMKEGKKELMKTLLHSYYCSLLYTRPRNWGFNVLYKKENPEKYQEYLKREPKNDFYNWIHLKGAKENFEAIIKNDFSDESKEAAELGLKVHEKLVELGLFKQLGKYQNKKLDEHQKT